MPVLDSMKERITPKKRGHMPVKRTINFAAVDVKKMHVSTAVMLVALVILASALFAKFAVIDRFAKVTAVEKEAASAQALIDTYNREIDSFGDLKTLYSHYTYSCFTSGELDRVSRVDMMDLIETMILPQCPVESWSVTENRLTLDITSYSLESINLLAQSITEHPLVEYCTFMIAHQTVEHNPTGGIQENVTSTLYIEMKPARKAAEEAKKAAEEAKKAAEQEASGR